MNREKWCLASCAIAVVLQVSQHANASNILDKAIREYQAGNYSQAVGLLGQAESTEFNNPILHYYLANALAKLNQKPDAIKEYRVALAMEPDGQMAKYCKQALEALGANEDPSKSKSSKSTTKDPKANPADKTAEQPNAKPQVIAILCGCPQCARIDQLFDNLHTTYGDKLTFTRVLRSSSDPKQQEILTRFGGACPQVLFLQPDGQVYEKDGASVTAQDLDKASQHLAASVMAQSNKIQDKHLADLASSISKEAEARIMSDKKNMEEQIARLQQDEEQQLASIPRRYNLGVSAGEIRRDTSRRIENLRSDFERKTKEIRAAAQSRIDSLAK